MSIIVKNATSEKLTYGSTRTPTTIDETKDPANPGSAVIDPADFPKFASDPQVFADAESRKIVISDGFTEYTGKAAVEHLKFRCIVSLLSRIAGV